MTVVDAELARISQRIRTWRAEAGMTLQDLARRSDVATSTIQKVETAQMVPSVAVMLKIARGLGRRPADLVHDGGDDLEVIHIRGAERHPLGTSHLELERLSGDLIESALESWRVTLHPGASSGVEPIHYNGEELVACESGELRVRVGEREHVLEAGDSLHFKASLPHSWRNAASEACRFTITGTIPSRVRAVLQERIASSS